MNSKTRTRALLMFNLVVLLVISAARMNADTGTCGGNSITLPFNDVPSSNQFFCSIAEAFFTGLTNGTSASTFSPSDPVPREQMAAFVTRTLDQSLKRGSRRAALKQFWTPGSADAIGLTSVDLTPSLVECDGADIWVGSGANGTVSRVRASDGKLLGTWTGGQGIFDELPLKNMIFATGSTSPGNLYQLDPTQAPGAMTNVSSSLGDFPQQMAFDGTRIWTQNFGGSVSIITLNPLSVTTVSTGFTQLRGIVFDGSNMWVTDQAAFTHFLFKLDAAGGILQTVSVGLQPNFPCFDGANIWVPNGAGDSVTVVRASNGQVLATLTGNGLSGFPSTAAFDGQRILVTNTSAKSVSLWRASDFSPLGTVSLGTPSTPVGVCSDGINFWIALNAAGKLARF